MRRIARLRKPSGAPLASIARPLCIQRAATRPSPSPAVQINTVRFYSSRQPETLPASLADSKRAVPEVLEDAVEGTEVQEYDLHPAEPRVFVPPPRPSVAERADTITDNLYTPASTAEGLESIGNLGNWWDDPEHWPETSDFVGFTPKQKVQEPVLIEAAVRRALTEALVVKQLGKDDQLTGHWGMQDRAQHDAVLALGFKVDSDGKATVTGNLQSVAEGLVAKDGEAVVDSAFALPSAAEALAWKQQSDHSWKGASLLDARVKFAVRCTKFESIWMILIELLYRSSSASCSSQAMLFPTRSSPKLLRHAVCWPRCKSHRSPRRSPKRSRPRSRISSLCPT